MSWHKVPKGKGGGWEVRWRQGGRQRSTTVHSRADAAALDGEIKRRKRLGTLAQLDAGTVLLSDFGAEWWERSVQKRLARSTRQRYSEVWDLHVLPRLGDYQLRELKAGVVEDDLVAAMLTAGVGVDTVRTGFYMLRSCLSYAVRRELIPYNPAREVELPRRTRRAVRPIGPVVIELMRHHLGQRDQLLLSLMGYQGLRPGEVLALTDDRISKRTMHVERSISFGEEKDTKTHRDRTVNLLAPVATELAEYRLATDKERLAGGGLLFPRADGQPWRNTDYRNWRRRTFKPAYRVALGLDEKADTPRPYHLRHTFVSMLIAEGHTIAYVAAQAGHSPEECARTYLHLFDEHQGASVGERVKAEHAIRAARVEAAAKLAAASEERR